jgi:G3E family GTPase
MNQPTKQAPRAQVPITIITGFLGAGKTTLLNYILNNNHGMRIAVLVNDFGSVNIDSELIIGVEGESVSLSNGCICCTIRDDLLKAVLGVIQRENPPEYIVIETSGVSDPFAVAETFMLPALRPFAAVDSIVTVVDAEQIRDLQGEQEVLAMDQISAADIIVMNKVDLVDKAGLSVARSFIREVVPDARILEVTHGRAPLELLLGVGQYSIEKLQSREKRDVHVHEDMHVHESETEHEHDHGHTHEHDRQPAADHFSLEGICVFEGSTRAQSRGAHRRQARSADLCGAVGRDEADDPPRLHRHPGRRERREATDAAGWHACQRRGSAQKRQSRRRAELGEEDVAGEVQGGIARGVFINLFRSSVLLAIC